MDNVYKTFEYHLDRITDSLKKIVESGEEVDPRFLEWLSQELRDFTQTLAVMTFTLDHDEWSKKFWELADKFERLRGLFSRLVGGEGK